MHHAAHLGLARVTSPEALHNVLQRSGAPLAISDTHGRISWSNAALAALAGQPTKDLLAASMIEFLPDHDQDKARTALQDIASGRTNEVTFKTHFGNLSAHSAVDWNLRFDRFSGSIIWQQATHISDDDTTLRTQLRDATEENESLDAFAHSVAHDLRAPLRQIVNFGTLLQTELGEGLSDEGQRWIQYVVDSAAALRRLVRDMLQDVHRDGETREVKDLPLADILRTAESNLQLMIEEADARIFISEELPIIEGVESELVSMFQNLIENAIKYSGNAHPEVHVSASDSDSGWTIDVRDNGIGIARHEQVEIFEMFRQLNPSDPVGGSGIGLATCERIAEAHGGKIWCTSVLGEGATFSCFLPRGE